MKLAQWFGWKYLLF